MQMLSNDPVDGLTTHSCIVDVDSDAESDSDSSSSCFLLLMLIIIWNTFVYYLNKCVSKIYKIQQNWN